MHQGAYVFALIQASCVGTEAEPYASIPTTSKACLAGAHEQRTVGVPASAVKQASPEPPPTEAPPNLVEGHRVSGQRVILPDDETRRAIHRMRVKQTAPVFKLCLDTTGVPKTIELLRSSCFPRYDAELGAKMSEWRYSPYLKDNIAVAVCTAITFIYQQ